MFNGWMFQSPKERVPLWPLALIGVLIIILGFMMYTKG